MTSRHPRTALRLSLVFTLACLTLGARTNADDFSALGLSSSPAPRASRAHVAKSAVSKTALPAGGEAMLAVSLDIGAGYHAQSHTPYDKFLIPFTIKLDENPCFRIPGRGGILPALPMSRARTDFGAAARGAPGCRLHPSVMHPLAVARPRTPAPGRGPGSR